MPGRGEVPVALLREAYEQSGMAPPDVARALGWYRTREAQTAWADGSRVARILGLRPYNAGHRRGNRRHREKVTYETAVKVCGALGLDPVDLGL